MFHYGIAMILSAGPALAGVLHALNATLVRDYHAALWVSPLTGPRSLAERRHLRRQCGECSLISEMITSRLA